MAHALTTGKPGGQVGELIREWRLSRGLSQLDLAMQAGFSARHLSFIETGRAQPSRDAVLALAETLEVPLRDRNRLLEAGGYARVFRETPLDAAEMTHVRQMVQFILDRHLPYPAVALDRYSTCVIGNRAAGQLIRTLVDPSLIVAHANFLRIVFHPLGARRWIVNWTDVAPLLLDRARRELGSPAGDASAGDLLAELRGYAAGLPLRARTGPLQADEVLLPIHIRRDGFELRLFSTIMTLGTPQDVTLQELRIETFFPSDPASEAAWAGLMERAESGDLVRW